MKYINNKSYDIYVCMYVCSYIHICFNNAFTHDIFTNE